MLGNESKAIAVAQDGAMTVAEGYAASKEMRKSLPASGRYLHEVIDVDAHKDHSKLASSSDPVATETK